MNLTNIITTYYAYLEYQGKTREQGYAEMNEALGTSHDQKFFNHLGISSKPVSRKLKRYLVDQCYEFSAKQHKFRNMKNVKAFLKSLEAPE